MPRFRKDGMIYRDTRPHAARHIAPAHWDNDPSEDGPPAHRYLSWAERHYLLIELAAFVLTVGFGVLLGLLMLSY